MKLNTYNLTEEGGITSQDPSEMAPEWFTDDQVRWVDVMASGTGETERLLEPLDLHETVRAAWVSPERRPEVIVLDNLLFVRLPYLGRSGEIHTLQLLCGPTAIVSARKAPFDEIGQLATALETGVRKIRPTVADLLIEILEAVFREAQQAAFELRDEIHDLSNQLETDAGELTIGDLSAIHSDRRNIRHELRGHSHDEGGGRLLDCFVADDLPGRRPIGVFLVARLVQMTDRLTKHPISARIPTYRARRVFGAK